MFLPKKGILKIDLQAKGGGSVDKAEIFVDGQKKCDITPCIVADLDPGSRTVKVIVPNAGPVDPVTALRRRPMRTRAPSAPVPSSTTWPERLPVGGSLRSRASTWPG